MKGKSPTYLERIGAGLNIFCPLHAIVIVKYEMSFSSLVREARYWAIWVPRMSQLPALNERSATTAMDTENAE